MTTEQTPELLLKTVSVTDRDSFLNLNPNDSLVFSADEQQQQLSAQNKVKAYIIRNVSIAQLEIPDDNLENLQQQRIDAENKAKKRDDNRRTSLYVIKQPESNTIEHSLRLEHLKKLKRIFLNRKKRLALSKNVFKKNDSPDSLTKDEFIEILSNCFQSSEYNDDLEKLFNKLDAEMIGRVTWNDFCTHLLAFYTQKNYSDSLQIRPFGDVTKISHSPHNRLQVTAKIMHLDNPLKFINISRAGAIGIWNKNLTLYKRFKLDQSIIDKPLYAPRESNRKYTTWVTDALMLNHIHKLVICTSARELRFFNISFEHCVEDLCIYGLPNVPTCLDYWFNETAESNESMLFTGYESGYITKLSFRNPADSLYDASFKPVKGATRIFWTDLKRHSEYLTQTAFKPGHFEAIRKIKYLRSSNKIISSSSDSKASVIIADLDCAQKTYVFEMNKGCLCFEYSKKLNLLVTGSTDSKIRLWDPYLTSHPVGKLIGHRNMVVDVKIHEHYDYLYSYSSDGALYVWDLIDSTIIQKIHVNFPSLLYGKVPEYGTFPMHLYFEQENPKSGLLLVSCDDYIAKLNIRDSSKEVLSGNVSHVTPITGMVYSSFLKQVFTVSGDSTLTYWNLDNGQQILTIKNAHGEEEITCLNLDKAQRNLFTGARDGTIKVWNAVNGCNIHNYTRTSDLEITDLVYIDDRRMTVSVGCNRKIYSYHDETQENFTVKAKPFSANIMHHNDEINCADACSSMLATGGYDGEINVWNTVTEKLLICLQKGQNSLIKWKNVHFESLPTDSSLNNNSAAPVDVLLFLRNRIKLHGLCSGVLVSSQSGRIDFWSFYSDGKSLSSFTGSDFKDEYILSICTDDENTVLVAGDSNGFVYIWNIEDYMIRVDVCMRSPKRLNAWRCHDNPIASCQYVDSSSSSYATDLLITASSDMTCKLWTIPGGKLVGIFGQKQKWDIRNEVTYAHFYPFDDTVEGRESVLPVLEAVAQFQKLINKTDDEEEKKNTFESTSIISTSDDSNKSSKYDYLSNIQYLNCQKTRFTSKYIEAKNERHKIYSDIDQKLVLRLPNICTPYVSLKLPKLETVVLPSKLNQ